MTTHRSDPPHAGPDEPIDAEISAAQSDALPEASPEADETPRQPRPGRMSEKRHIGSTQLPGEGKPVEHGW